MNTTRTATLIVLAVMLVASACSSSAPDAIALAESSNTTTEATRSEEVVSEPAVTAASAPSTTTTTTVLPAESSISSSSSSTSSTTTTTEAVQDPAVCTKGDNFPQFEGAVGVVEADVDLDGQADEVYLLAEPKGLSHDAWVAVSFASGGMATGRFDGFFEVGPAHGLQAIELTNGSGTTPEILFTASSGPAISQTAVMTLIDCEVVTTTLLNDEFSFNSGASSGYASTGGCAYGTGGRIEFTVTEQNPNIGEWTTTVYTLDGSTWTQLERTTQDDFPGLESPVALNLSDCEGVQISE